MLSLGRSDPGRLRLLAQGASAAVYAPLQLAGAYELGKHVLLIHGYGA